MHNLQSILSIINIEKHGNNERKIRKLFPSL